MKKILFGIFAVLLLTSCVKEIDDLDVKKMVKESRELEKVATTERPTSTIKIHDKFDETKIVIPVEEETTEEETIKAESIEELVEEKATNSTIEENEVTQERKQVALDDNFVKLKTYSNKSSAKFISVNPPVYQNAIDLSSWGYGMTPLEWIFVEPNNQLISNNKPNSSPLFAYKSGASSGSKGCFIPVFSRCDSLGSDYEGRVYAVDDYTKSTPENMLWANKFTDMVYEGHRVIDILADKYEVDENDEHIAKVDNTYINVVYVSELDDILGK